ncbi:TRAP transporter substrate-binding protein [Brachybacterium sacelli]|uniref:Tripartite ATP-independent transporter DctP family solute receptor n=1 Tax=Brachybacterium sacelli TaxID=173364 RepID=A0ABS4X055_9MICO|nr:tripartite ATP-independent transporter DctP family solute receptor [Brachybacterium sacelli]
MRTSRSRRPGVLDPAVGPRAAARRGIGRRDLLTALPAAGIAAAVLGGCASTEGAVTGVDRVLSISLGQTESHPSYGSLVSFGERLAEATDGRYGARVYANNSLGDQQETVQLVSDGAIDLAVISGTQIENSSARFLPMNLPGVFDDIDHQNRVMLDDSIVGELFASLEPQMRLTVLGGYTQGSRHLYTAQGPIASPEDLAGLKIRVQESEVFLRLIENLGGVPTPLAYSEVYTALQAGVLDGAENNEISYVTQRHYEVAKHFTMTNHLVGFDFLLASTDLLEEMSEQDARLLKDAWNETQSEFVEIWKRETDEAVQQMTEQGVAISRPDPEVFAPIIEETGVSILEDPRDIALYDAIRAVGDEGSGR